MKTQEERKRKMLLVLPLLLLPFLALAFYALGGGKGNLTNGNQQISKGLNTTLPGAQLQHEKAQDKMALYDKAMRDSAAAKSRAGGNAFAALGWDTSRQGQTYKSTPAIGAQANETKINQKLAEINRQISQPEPVAHYQNNYSNTNSASPDLDRMEKLIKSKEHGNTPDPEMKQLNTMLDKIMQIQNPGLAKAKQTDKPVSKDSAFKAIPAMIDGNQKVMNGGVVKLRLQDTIRINGVIFPKGQSLSGSCTVTNQRLLLDIKNIRLGTSILPVNLTVFSLDGMQGINAPEAELGGAAGDGANGALENMEFLSMDQSVSTQAATAGINAAKGLLGKKVKKIRVKLKGGVTVLLRNNK
ncbi:MAG TPA: conjugal transfer protein TraM [Mucilaginibacter sp.]|jgi:hypothetical protein|nr:conjugal transfer protein TraM [Mucilaginibacter sp.]